MTAFVTEAQVREYLNIEGTTGKYADAILASNIRTASYNLQKWTGRQFENQPATSKSFTTHGRTQMSIPDLRSATSVTLQSTSLSAGETYHLIPDRANSGIYVAIQFRPYGRRDGPWWLSNPEWFDRNLDSPYYAAHVGNGLPNDLVITGNWGWSSMPDDLLHATKVLAGWYTRRPSSLLANVSVTPEGAEMRFSDLPPEVLEFVRQWSLGDVAAAF